MISNPSSEGMDPVNELPNNPRYSKLISNPSSEGMDPVVHVKFHNKNLENISIAVDNFEICTANLHILKNLLYSTLTV